MSIADFINVDYEEFKKHIYSRDRIPVVDPLQMELEQMALEEMLKTNVTTAFEVPEDYLNDSYNDHQADVFRYAISQINKEEDNMPTVGMSASEPREMWSIYHVIAIEKENCGEGFPEIDTKVVAKNAEHAKGLAGVNTMLERNNFDNTKITVICDHLATIKPVEDDE
jgi:hypothetical protein